MSRILIVLGLMLLVFCAGILAALAGATRTERKAKDCFHDILALNLGRSTFEDAERLKNLYNGIASGYTDEPCTIQSCRLIFHFENAWLQRLRLAPRTVFDMAVGVSNGVIDGRELAYESDVPGAFGLTVVSESTAGPGKDNFNVRVLRDTFNRPSRVIVRITTAASPEERERAYSFNVECLATIGGCKDNRQVFPQVLASRDQVPPNASPQR